MYNLSVALLVMASLTACSDTPDEKKQEIDGLKNDTTLGATKQKSVLEINKETPKLVLKDKAIKSDQSGQFLENIQYKKNNVLMINKEKFTLRSESLTKGAKVFNILMSEPGTVKGTFVVIVNEGEKSVNIDNTAEINEIAKNTYRLTPKKGVEFLKYYKLLLSAKQLQQVEMEIDYSGKNRLSPQER
ncbi:MAG: hypothetical protein V7780_05580 [Colwellia sp.]|jgi:hypothetical protein|uniref:hypothetical protein n=1 Tax=Colwellia sp. Bg11-12 TaxID=2759817 RepID=UPI0015F58A5F|nr:hypothetical protein [Colwellia sp. Bg11-12]MBA6263932.1 hypothetical protein [Colwellia sp. Bg11-12]